MRRILLSLLALPLSLAACAESPYVDSGSIESTEQEIIGGDVGRAGDFPTTVAISNGGLCTGTLIAPDLILTAAHCISPSLLGMSSQQQVTANTQVVLDADNLFGGSGRAIRASETIPHPGFSINGLGDNDIGLIRLATPVTDRAFTPINRNREDAPVGVNVTMVGYGASQVGGGGAGQLYILRDRKATSCASYGVTDAKLLCFNQSDGRGKCQGDSGGPSYAIIDGVERVVGVTSFGDQACAQFGADTRVDAELDFLYQHAPELACQAEGSCNEDCGKNGLPVDDDCQICESDADCGDEEVCAENGACIPAPFTPGGDGAYCAANEECNSGMCAQTSEEAYCTTSCDSDDQCLEGFECVAAGESSVCWPQEETKGGCSTSGSGTGGPFAFFLLALAILPLARRRQS